MGMNGNRRTIEQLEQLGKNGNHCTIEILEQWEEWKLAYH